MDAQLLKFPKHVADNGTLCVYECGKHVKFDIKRVFMVSGTKGDARGEHAHKHCAQLMVCVSGEVIVTCDDGDKRSEYRLDDMGVGLLVPPGIWARQKYATDNSVLMVMCDRVYEEHDYIRHYNEYLVYLNSTKIKIIPTTAFVTKLINE